MLACQPLRGLVASRCGKASCVLWYRLRQSRGGIKVGRGLSSRRWFLKKNKKIRPVHKLFCILILMIQMTARNFTKSPEGPYWYCTKKRKKRNKRRQEIRGNITRSNWILRCHLYKEDVNYCFSCIKIKREKTKSAKNDKKTWWERDICCSNAEQGPIWLLKQR